METTSKHQIEAQRTHIKRRIKNKMRRRKTEYFLNSREKNKDIFQFYNEEKIVDSAKCLKLQNFSFSKNYVYFFREKGQETNEN